MAVGSSGSSGLVLPLPASGGGGGGSEEEGGGRPVVELTSALSWAVVTR